MPIISIEISFQSDYPDPFHDLIINKKNISKKELLDIFSKHILDVEVYVKSVETDLLYTKRDEDNITATHNTH